MPAAPAPRASRVALVVLAALLVFGVARAATRAWTCDDAFISIRYADHLASGQGLVYNPGERVEGYTNLSWTLLLAAAIALGLPPVESAEALGIAAYVALALVLAQASWRQHRRAGLPFLPVAAGLVLVMDDFHDWATGGLETMLFSWLATWALLATRAPAPTPRSAAGAGALFSLLVLTRPDGLLFAAVGLASYALPPGRLAAPARRACALAFLAPLAATLAALAAFKLAYYGELLPTAFHSKSVLRPYWSQGLFYLGLFLSKNWFLPVALAGALAARILRRAPAMSARDWDDAVGLLAALSFLAYLAHVGGDFMFARRILPAAPLLFFAIEGQLVQLRGPRRRAAAAVACLAAAALPHPVFDDEHVRVRGIADERRFYGPSVLEARRAQAEFVGRALAGSPARVVFEGGMCMFGYYSRLPYLVEITGLTQYSLARLPLERRGWVGHEKAATDEWLARNGIHFIVSHRFPPLRPPPTGPAPDRVYFGQLALARILLYSDAIMERLERIPGVRFVPIEETIERTRRIIERGSLGEAEAAYARLERFYLRGAGARGEALARELHAEIEAKRAGAADRASAGAPHAMREATRPPRPPGVAAERRGLAGG